MDKLIICLFLTITTVCFAQKREAVNTSDRKHLQIDFSAGSTFDMIHSGTHPYAGLMSSKSTVTPLIGVRVTHLFTGKLGWYANAQLNFYREKDNDWKEMNLADEIFNAFSHALMYTLLGPVAIARPSVDAGLVYRLERKNWAVYPRLGIGYMYYLGNTTHSRTKNQQELSYIQKAQPLYLTPGISVNWFFSERAYLALNADYRQPLQKSYAELIYTENGIESDRLYYQTKTAGRGINCGIGIGVRLF